MSTKPTTIRLGEGYKERLTALAELRERSPSSLMQEAIKKFVHQEEELEQERRIVQERWEHFQLTGDHLTHAQITNWIESLPE